MDRRSARRRPIVEFVRKTTDKASPDYVPPAERIATFDNDGTLWAEQPMYVQAMFALDRVKALAPQHPEWQTQEPFASVLKGDLKGALAGGDKALLEIVMATHAGMTTDEFQQIVKDWIATAKNPVTKRPVHRDGVPADGRTARVPARARLQDVHRVGRWHRVHAPVGRAGVRRAARAGGGVEHQDQVRDAGRQGVLVRLPELNFIDDKEGKPIGINQHIGHRPIAAFGNSDGDRQMLEYATTGTGARFGMLVLHDDQAREFAYGPATGLPDRTRRHVQPGAVR